MPQDISRNCTVCYLHYHSKTQLSSLKLKSGTKLKHDANWFKLKSHTPIQVYQSISCRNGEQYTEVRGGETENQLPIILFAMGFLNHRCRD